MWSFSAPEDVEDDNRWSLQQRQLAYTPQRPLSAEAAEYLMPRPPREGPLAATDDIVMTGVIPATAPLSTDSVFLDDP